MACWKPDRSSSKNLEAWPTLRMVTPQLDLRSGYFSFNNSATFCSNSSKLAQFIRTVIAFLANRHNNSLDSLYVMLSERCMETHNLAKILALL